MGQHQIQLYSEGTPNGVKVTIALEAICDAYPEFDYDAWRTGISGNQASAPQKGAALHCAWLACAEGTRVKNGYQRGCTRKMNACAFRAHMWMPCELGCEETS